MLKFARIWVYRGNEQNSPKLVQNKQKGNLMSSYEDAIRKFNHSRRSKIHKILSSWEQKSFHGRVIAPNILLERFLPVDHMAAILEIIFQKGNSSLKALEDEYPLECHKHVLKGKYVHCAFPKTVGRAVEREDFIQYLLGISNFYNLGIDIEDVIDKAIYKRLFLPEEAKDIAMSTHAAWVTWNETDSSADPYDFIQYNHADEVRACLGLPYRKGKLILLIYKVRHSTLRCPTIADAGLYPYFQPPGLSNDHGVTKPRATQDENLKKIKFKPKPRPEAVHKSLTFESLSEIRELS